MEAKEIAAIVDSMYEDELDVLSQPLALSEPERPDAMILRENGLPFCPVCGCVLSKNGTDGKGHQKWICGGCGKTVSSSTSRPTARTRLSARKWLSFVKCELAGVPLRLSSAYCRVSLKAAFMLRHKLQCAISSVVSAISLAGRVELDAKFIRANFKGTRPRDMPRKSKRRGHGSAGHMHKVCVIFAIDEFDSFVGLVAGIGDETREKADAMLPFLAGCETLVTDERSCYEAFARDNGFRHVQIKGIAGHSNEDGETMNEVNGLMSEFETWLARFRGVSSKHLQGYVDRFLLQKALSYAKEAMDRPGAELSRLLKTKSVILCREILSKAMPFDVKEAYGKWHCGVFGDK
jgi:transposase-like protein